MTAFVDRDGVQVATAWLRRLTSRGEWVFSGCYRMRLHYRLDRG